MIKVIVDGAQGSMAAQIINKPEAQFWNVIDKRLNTSKVSRNQVQVIWIKQAVSRETKAFPAHAIGLKDNLKEIIDIAADKYPNLKIVYLSSRIYGGYATNILSPEPYAYEGGFSVKWLIEERINGKMDDNTPWLSWGPYLWANGMQGRSDGLIWERSDVRSNDGTHPSETGQLKVANMLLDFFKKDVTAKTWFVK